MPFTPMVNGYYSFGYDIDMYACMMDFRNMIPGVTQFIEDLNPDGLFIAGLYGVPVLDTLGAQHINWPGATCGIPLNGAWQHVDGC